ncbi:hypothetical protein NW764_001306 [Fusarium oxysporum]|nr:hypothetical protein NW764_001306 [Fusarium oxysporum]
MANRLLTGRDAPRVGKRWAMNFVERILKIFQFRKVGKFRKRTRSGPHIAFQKLELIGNSSGFDSGIGKELAVGDKMEDPKCGDLAPLLWPAQSAIALDTDGGLEGV